jgi:hypothetical protein
MAEECRASLQVCAFRIGKLNSSGQPTAGVGNMLVSDSMIDIDVGFETTDASEFEQRNGCDSICVSFTGCEKIKAVTFDLNMCTIDHEAIQMMTEGAFIASGGVNIGHQPPAVSSGCPNGVSFEVWTRRWNGTSPDAVRPYWHWVFPKTFWRVGDLTMENDVLVFPLSGKGTENYSIGNGIANDLASPPNNYGRLYTVFAANDFPAVQCGAVTAPAS